MLFTYHLAREFHCPVDELLGRMSTDELQRWRAYFGRHPWSWQVQEFYLAQLAAVVHNAGFGARRTLTPADFILEPPRPRQTAAQVTEVLRQWGAVGDAMRRQAKGG